MARRFSRSEKEKWSETPRSPRKRSPIKIPGSNNEALIADNKLTLIGRVTNPEISTATSCCGPYASSLEPRGKSGRSRPRSRALPIQI